MSMRSAALRLALGRWVDAARFLEPALGSSAAQTARLHARVHELQAALAEGRGAMEGARSELQQHRVEALAARQLIDQGERVVQGCDAERKQLTDELGASELRCSALEARLHSLDAMLTAAHTAAQCTSGGGKRSHALRDTTNHASSAADRGSDSAQRDIRDI
jgi:hypothetical protein